MTTPTMSTRTTQNRRMSRNTGFPEPFDTGSNTTLPHPDADLSPNACITHNELAGDLANRRRRLSFLHRHKSKRSVNHGFINSQTDIFSSVLSLTLPDMHSDKESEPQSLTRSSTASRYSKDETESVDSKKDDESPPTSPDSMNLSHKKNHFFGKWKR
ncbi:hypothetical protein PT974_11609 [Cladobotryum mycophilum]|uniref:Uncharacterized protein n=1 Tax=Cladobotryum mycophilum TaxID=491253 RepID=A0ABR0S5P7_9HYPO